MKKLFSLCLAVLSIIGLSAFQITEDPIQGLLKKLTEFSKKYPAEKVYLHLDKPYYAAGDNIWFKAYVTDWKTGELTAMSAVLHVELINPRNNIEKKITLPMENGLTWGDFKLTDTLSAGNYRIRAYTQWMRNAGPNFFFDKTIKIGNGWVKKAQKETPTQAQAQPVDVQFLPEGGTLLEGVKSKIAIKAIGSNGLGTKVKGKIVDQIGTEVTTFETSDLGMGGVYLISEPNKTYAAKIDPNQSIPLPKAAKTGYSIAISKIDSTKLRVIVKISEDLLNKGELSLVAQKNGLAYSLTKLVTTAKATETIYENKDLPQGIVQFTLFTPNLTPVCERIVFVNNTASNIKVDLQQLKPSYAKKEKVEVSLFSSLKTKPLPGSFSVSVTNADVVTPDLTEESNILANLLLTSDLTGYVEQPNSYFQNSDAKTVEALDYLMLTQGWRKIDWKFVEPVITHEVEKGLKIRGVVTKNNIPVPLGPVSLVTNKDGIFKIDTVTNDKGEFAFENLEFSDSTKFIIQARTEANKKDVRVGISHYPEQEVTPATTKDLAVNSNQNISNYVNKSTLYFEEQQRQGRLSRTILLNEVNIVKKPTKPAPNSKNLNGPGNADQIIDVSQLWMANSVSSYLQGRIAGVEVRNGQATNLKSLKTEFDKEKDPVPGGNDRNSPYMHVILDGMDMGSTGPYEFNLNQLNPNEIESIEILTSLPRLSVYGPMASRGLIIVTSKKGSSNASSVKYAPGVTTYTPKGYYVAREFYSPKYDVAPSDKPDLRTTVFWAPNLVTDETGKAKFDYFNTDQPGNYRMLIEGIDLNGNLARKTYTYTIK